MVVRGLVSLAGPLLAAIALSSCATGPARIPPPSQPAPIVPVPPPPPVPPEREEAPQPVLVGYVTKVTDGDTIKVQLSSGPITVRFDSIDAPESDQPWGGEATAALSGRLSGQEVALDVVSQDRYERLVAVVYLGDENINGWMVKQGHAWAYRDYLNDSRYCAWEGVARASGVGLWGLPPDRRHAPWEWRRAKRDDTAGFTDYSGETVANCVASMRRQGRSVPAVPAPPATPQSGYQPTGNCLIKGNISDSDRIYHVPGSAFYERTVIDESAGERWFCTEAEALSAGWRAPRTAATR